MICGENLTYDSKQHYRDVAMAIMEYYLAANEQTPEERVKALKDFLSSFKSEDANAIFT